MKSIKIRHRKALKGLISPRSIAFSGILVAMLAGGTANAQVAGTTQTTNYHLPFSANENSVELPAPASLDLSRAEFQRNFTGLAGINFNSNAVGSAIANVVGLAGLTIPPEFVPFIDFLGNISPVQGTLQIGPSFSFNGGVYIQANELTNSEVAIEYPVNVEVEFPQPNTFGCGDEIVIHTSYTVDGAPSMDVAPPFTDLEFGPVVSDVAITFKAQGNLTLIDSTLFGNWTFNESFPLATLDVPEPGPFFRFCESAFQPDATNADLFACDPGTELLWNMADLFVDYSDNYSLCGPLGCDYGFVEYTPTEQKWDLHTPDFPTIPGASLIIPKVSGFVQKLPQDALGSSFNAANGKLTSAGNKQIADAAIDLLSLLPKPTTDISLGGNVLGVDLGDISPTLKVNQELSFDFQPKVHVRLDLGAPMQYRVEDNGVVVQDNMYGQYPEVLAGQDIVAIYPQALSTPLTVSNEFDMNGDFNAGVVQKYNRSWQVAALKYTAFGYTSPWAFTYNSPDELLETDTLAKGGILFDSFDAFNGAPFELDPENPIVEVDELIVQDVVNVGGGERLVVYKTGISNGGDVKLHDVIQNLDLDETFESAISFEVECITSPDFDVNYNFNGKTDINMLAAGNELEVGEEGTINGAFAPVIYDASTTAYGTSPIGTVVESNFNHCTQETTANDIVASVDLGAAVIDELADYTVYGKTQVDMQKTSNVCRGNVGSTSEVSFQNSSLFTAEHAEIIGDIHSGALLKLVGTYDVTADYIQVGQSIVLNGSSILNYTGSLSAPSATTGVQVIPSVTLPANNSSVNVTAGTNQSYTLNPGSYKKVTVNANSILNMRTGVYNVDTWYFAGNNAQVKYDVTNGPIVINVNKWQPLGRTGTKFIVTQGANTPNCVKYNYKGNQDCLFIGSTVHGTINAPAATMIFDNASKLEGRCYANRVKFDRQSYYVDPLYLDDLKIDATCLPPSTDYRSLEVAASNENNDAIETADAIGLYPNPNRGQLFNINIADVTSDEVYVSILDATGRLVYNNRYVTSGSLNTVVAFTQPLKPGVYMVQFLASGVVTNKQMIVE